MKKLPHKPSDLIRVALVDLEKIEKSEKYRVDMGVWHDPGSGVCEVCLAGSVMAITLGADPTEDLTEDDFSGVLGRQLDSLDYFRMGGVGSGFSILGGAEEYGDKYTQDAGLPFDRGITNYHNDSVVFKAQMAELASDLEKAGY